MNPVPEHLQEASQVTTVLWSSVQANCGEVGSSVGGDGRACEQLLPWLHHLLKDLTGDSSFNKRLSREPFNQFFFGIQPALSRQLDTQCCGEQC